MREIKFRVWIPQQKIMYYFPSYFLDCRVGKTEIDWNNIMQFTGLTDKNGKEIYEGDIYKTSPSDDLPDEVIYNPETGGWDWGYDIEEFALHPSEDWEIVGNIYEGVNK